MEVDRELGIKAVPDDREQGGCHSGLPTVSHRAQAIVIKRLQAEIIHEAEEVLRA
jgi:hypothetical protein